jgi:hypothetical protein
VRSAEVEADVDHRQPADGRLGGREQVHGFGHAEGHRLIGEHRVPQRHLAGRVSPAGQVDGHHPRVLRDRLDPVRGLTGQAGAAADPEDAVHDHIGLGDHGTPAHSTRRHQGHARRPGRLQTARVRRRRVNRRGRKALLREHRQRVQGIAPVVSRAHQADDPHTLPLLQPGGDHGGQSPGGAGHQLAVGKVGHGRLLGDPDVGDGEGLDHGLTLRR